MDTLETLKHLKKHTTYRNLAKLTGAPEQALIRWITGKTTMSQAWQALIERNLSE
jgi:hypothetical protein